MILAVDVSRIAWRRPLWTGLLFHLVLLVGCSHSAPEIFEFNGETMGTTWSVKVGDMPAGLEPQQVADKIQAALDGVNESMSTYLATSELSRFNQAPAGTRMPVSAALFEVMRKSVEVWRLSQGTFDVTVGPLVNLWGFGPQGRSSGVPDEEAQRRAWARVGTDALTLHTETLELEKQKDLYVDLSAIAKGFGVDKVAETLENLGIRRYLVEVGGEMRAGEPRSAGQPWRVAVEKPWNGARAVERMLSVSSLAMATSGDYRNYFEVKGKRYSHTIDPRTGKPIDHALASATVIAPTCAEADAWATAMMVLGPDQALAVAQANHLAVYLLVKSGDGFEVRSSEAFAMYLKPELQ